VCVCVCTAPSEQVRPLPNHLPGDGGWGWRADAAHVQFIELLNAIRDKHLVPGAPRGEYLKDYQPKADPRTLDGLPMSDLGPGLERPRTKRQMALAALRDHREDDEEDDVVASTPQRGVSHRAAVTPQAAAEGEDGGAGGGSGRSKREAGSSSRGAEERGSRGAVVRTPGTPATPEVEVKLPAKMVSVLKHLAAKGSAGNAALSDMSASLPSLESKTKASPVRPSTPLLRSSPCTRSVRTHQGLGAYSTRAGLGVSRVASRRRRRRSWRCLAWRRSGRQRRARRRSPARQPRYWAR
jgi:hypothetical protein